MAMAKLEHQLQVQDNVDNAYDEFFSLFHESKTEARPKSYRAKSKYIQTFLEQWTAIVVGRGKWSRKKMNKLHRKLVSDTAFETNRLWRTSGIWYELTTRYA